MSKSEPAQTLCELCGEPMPAGEEMFNYHGYSGNCPKPPQQTREMSPEGHPITKHGPMSEEWKKEKP